MDLMELLKTPLPFLTEDTDDSIEDAERSIPMKEPPKRWRNKWGPIPTGSSFCTYCKRTHIAKTDSFGCAVYPSKDTAETEGKMIDDHNMERGWPPTWLGSFPVEE